METLLEGSIEIPRSLHWQSTLRIQEEDYRYAAAVKNIRLSGDYIVGDYELAKYRRKPARRWKLISILPPKLTLVQVTIDQLVWEVAAPECESSSGSLIITPRKGVAENGRANLRARLAEGNILVSDTLLDTCFGPIEKELLRIWKQIFSFGKNFS